MSNMDLSKDDMSAMYKKARDIVNGRGSKENIWNDFQVLLKEYNVYQKCQPVNEKWAKMKRILADKL